MTSLEDFQESVWSDLPVFRRVPLGRERVNDLVAVAIEQCPLDLCGHVTAGSAECDVIAAAWAMNVKRTYSLMYGGDEVKYGPLFWILVSPVLNFIIQKVLDWFFASKQRRATLAKWKRGLTR